MIRHFLLVLFLVAAARTALAQEGFDSTNRPERPAYTAWARGRDAERAGKPAEAFAAYSEALRDEPGNAEYRVLVERMRFALADSFSNRAERAILADNPVEAAVQLRRALSYDPANEAARQRLRQLERHAVEETAVTPVFAVSSPELSPQPGPRDFNYRGPVRGAWLELARQFGLLALYDEDVTTARVQFNVPAVDFATARNLLGEQTGTFIRALDARTFLVVNDTQQKRKEFLPQIERTLLLPESEKPEQLNEIVRAVRDIAGLTHTQFDTRTRSLTVRGAERDVALAGALVRQLEQPRGEVMLEIDIVQVNRNSAENLGIVPPSSARVVTLSASELRLAQQSTNGLVQLIEQLFGTPAAFAGSSTEQISSLLATGSTSLSALVPPLIAFGGGQTIFLATLPGATANFASSLSVVQRAQRILLRAEDGEPASFFVGLRYPINFATLSNEFTSQGAQPGIREGTFATGASPRGVATAALNPMNSFLGIVTANHDAGTVSVLLGNGDGSFHANLDYPAGTNPVAVAAAAFRTMGQVAVAASPSGFTENAAGTVATVTTAVPHGLATGVGVSITGAGNPAFNGTFSSVTVTGPTTFTVPNTVAAPNATSGGGFVTPTIEPADLAVVDQGTNNVQILLGKGDGTFLLPVAYPVGAQPSGIVLGDFNGDGHTDIAVTNTASNSVSILLGNGDGTFQPAVNIPLVHGLGPVGIASADFNTDGSADLIVANSSSNTATILFGDGHGHFPTQLDINTGTFPVAVAAADFNGDGHPDFAVANQSDGTVSVFLNTGATGTAIFKTENIFTVGSHPSALITGDFNNDSRPDFVAVNSGDGTITVLFGAGDGTFPASIPIQVNAGLTCSNLPPPSVPCQGIASADFNADGLLDVAVSDPANNTITVVINSNQIAAANEQLPYPGFQYEDIGIKAKATPHIHPSGDVTLALSLELRSLSAVSFNGIPVISNRTVEQTVRLRPGEPSVLSGIFSDQESLAVTGTPGAADIPVLQDLLTNRNPQTQQTELVIVVNPRLVRIAPRTQEVFFAGHERQSAISSGGIETEQPVLPQTFPGQPPAPGQFPVPGQPPVPGQVPPRPGETPPGVPPERPIRP